MFSFPQAWLLDYGAVESKIIFNELKPYNQIIIDNLIHHATIFECKYIFQISQGGMTAVHKSLPRGPIKALLRLIKFLSAAKCGFKNVKTGHAGNQKIFVSTVH